MNRRNFLSLFGAGVAGIAISKAIPFGRVWSFPKEIVIPPQILGGLRSEWVTVEMLRRLENNLVFWESCGSARSFKVGQTIRVRLPHRYLLSDGSIYPFIPAHRKRGLRSSS
jgi:hypothetical protein